MKEPLIKYCYYPLTQAIRGYRVEKYLRELQSHERLARGELLKIQRQKLLETVKLASTTRFYRERFRQSRFDPDSLDGFFDMEFTGKTDIQGRLEDFQPLNFNDKMYKGRTSGSTGTALKLQFDYEWDQWNQAAQLRGKKWWGIDIGDRELTIWGRPLENPREHWKIGFKMYLMNRLELNPFDMSDRTMEKAAPKIIRYQPRFIYGYSTGIGRLAEFLLDHYDREAVVQPRAIIATAETLFEPHRRAIRRAFNIEPGLEYGAAETGIIAYSCPNGNMHLNLEGIHLEIAEPDKDGFGRVIVTPLLNRAMILLRYELGDRGRLGEGDCPCGRNLPIFELANARTTEMISTENGAIASGTFFDYIGKSLVDEELRQFRVIQKSMKEFEVQIVSLNRLSSEIENRIRKHFRMFIGQEIEVRITYHDALTPDKSGKLRYFIREDF